MKLSELARQITDYIAENGDVDVVVEDAYRPDSYLEPFFHTHTIRENNHERVIAEL